MPKKNKFFILEWGWVYWNGFIYHHVLQFLQGKAHTEMYQRVAEIVGNQSVLDLCSGDGRLSQWLSHKQYIGIDTNPRFVKEMRHRGLRVIEGDVRSADLPSAECAVLIESFYHFIPEGQSLINKILSHPFQKVIIVESVSHVSGHSVSWISEFALWSTRVCGRSFRQRLSPTEFQELLHANGFVQIQGSSKHLFAVWERARRSQ